MSETENSLPFNTTLLGPIYENSSLYSLVGQPDKIVRFNYIDEIDQGPQLRQCFTELESYGINLPKNSWLLCLHDNKKSLCVITDTVIGFNIHDALRSGDNRVAWVVDGVMANLMRYYKNKYLNGGVYLSDIRTDQFIYNSDTSTACMVDFGLVVAKCEPSEQSSRSNLLKRIRSLSQDVASAEYETKQSMELTRVQFSNFMGPIIVDTDDLGIAISL